MKKKENGAIIVEATLVLPFFMFAIITVLSIVNISFAQAKIGTALNETAKEISQYSYIYGLTGLNKKQAQLYGAGENARASIDEVVGGVSEIFSSASNMGGTVSSSISDPTKYNSAINSVKSDIDNIKGGVNTVTDGAKALASDPMAILKMIANEGIELAKSYLVKVVTPVFMEKHLIRSSEDSAESFLRYLGVVPKGGSYMDGLDFGQSVIFLNGSEEIKLIVSYEIQVWKFFGMDIKLPFTQCAATKAWFSAEAPNIVENSDSGSSEGSSDGSATEGTTGTNDGIVSGGEEGSTAGAQPQIKTAKEYAKEATQNDSSTQVVLGKYNSDFNGQSYIDMAIMYDATYFDMDDYDEVASMTDSSFMWSINEEFLKDQEAKGKQFILVDNPYAATGAYGNEVAWLQNHGYTFNFDPGTSVWKAVKSDG